MASTFVQPPIEGYSPWTTARQDTPYLLTPGVQGLQEGVSQGQGLGFSPSQEFWSSGTEGTAPPSSIPPKANMWTHFGGSGGAPSSLASQDPMPQQSLFSPGNMQNLIQAIRGK